MSSAHSDHSSRKRRSPRLPKAVEVKLAGRGESGEVIVESTETIDISKHGACVITRNRFPLGSPIAVRRPNAAPMRARVVSAKPGEEAGTTYLGVEFVGDDGNWDLEFPKDWNDYFRRDAAAEDPEARGKLRLEEGALESVLRKAEKLRNQAESMLAEYAAQVDGARRQNTSVLASQVEEFRAWKSILQGETSSQASAAKEAIAADLERARQRLEQETAELTAHVAELTAQCKDGLKSSEALYQQVRVTEAQKNVKQVAFIASQLEAQRKTMAAIEAQSNNWKAQTTANLDALQREIQALLQKAAGEIQTASAASIKDFRQKLPGLSQEMEKYFANFLSEQKLAATAWLEQAAKNMRAGTTTLEKETHAALERSGEKSLEEFAGRLAARLEDFRKAGDALAEPLDARAERMRGLLAEMASETDQALERVRQNLASIVEKSGQQLAEQATQKITQLTDAETACRKRIDAASEGMLNAAHAATSRVDQASLDLQALGSTLHQQAAANRKELEAQFAGLLSMYDNRKTALDKLLETLETGRTTLRDGLDMLRVNAEEHQARLQRFTADQEASLKARTSEMEQRLAASLTRMEAELRERASATLDSSHQAFGERIQHGSEETQLRFSESLEARMKSAAERIPGMLQQLDQCLAQHSAALASDLAMHQEATARSRESFEEHSRSTTALISENRAAGEEAIRLALTVALTKVEDRQASACNTVGDLLKNVESQQAAAMRQYGDHEKQVQKWRSDLSTEFSKLSARLDEKRTVLESFYTFAEQTKSAWVKNMGAIDRRIEDARTAIAGVEKQTTANMEKHSLALGEQLEGRLKQSLESAQHELNAEAEASEGVFQARLNDFSQQTLKVAERQVEKTANGNALALDRTMQKERREHERQVSEMGRRFDDSLREQVDIFRDQAGQAVAEMREQMQQVCREMLDQVKEAREELARELPGRLSAAEETFRHNLDRIQERTIDSATEEMRSRASQWKARSEMEMTK